MTVFMAEWRLFRVGGWSVECLVVKRLGWTCWPAITARWHVCSRSGGEAVVVRDLGNDPVLCHQIEWQVVRRVAFLRL